MNNKIFLTLFFLLIMFCGCVDEKDNETKNEKVKTQIIFDAVDILGKNSSEVDKMFGKPNEIVTGYRYYIYKKELGIFFEDENKNTKATGVLYIFDRTITDAIEAASLLGIDLSNIKPYEQVKLENYALSKYKTIEKGKKN